MDPLNNDCIDYIFDYLDLRSKVNFALASTQCSEHFMRWAESKLKVVNKIKLKGLSVNEIRSVIRFAGQFIENVELCSDFLPEIVKFCTKLKHLHITLQYTRSFETQIPTLAMIKTLESLHYDVEDIWNKSLETVIKTIVELPKLKKLNLNSEGYAGKYLKDLKHIETLILTSNKHLDYEHFEEFCASTKTLRTLCFGQVSPHDIDTEKYLNVVIPQCQSLEIVFLLNSFKAEEHLIDLRGIYMVYKNDDSWDSIFETLTEITRKKLEALCLYPFTVDIYEAATIGNEIKLKQLHCCRSSDPLCPKLIYFGNEPPTLTNEIIRELVNFFENDICSLYIVLHSSIKKEMCDREYLDCFIINNVMSELFGKSFVTTFVKKFMESKSVV